MLLFLVIYGGLAMIKPTVATQESAGNSHAFCECRLPEQNNVSLLVHCSDKQADGSGDNCINSEVVDWNLKYKLIPGYALVRVSIARRTWLEAQKLCRRDGSRLAVPRDRWAASGLAQLMRSEQSVSHAFVGISDLERAGVYRTLDGEDAPFLEWKPGEPNRINGSEHCVALGSDGLMSDVSCERPAAFYCERRLPEGLPVTYKWAPEASRFYKVHTERLTHQRAEYTCRSEYATLAVPDTWRRAEAMLRLLETDHQYYHVGFTDVDVEGDFITSTGRHLSDMQFQLWDPYQPNNYDNGREEDCLSIRDYGTYNDVRCDKELRFVCEIVPT